MTPDRGGKIFVGKGCGEAKPDFVRRAKDLEFDYTPDQFPILFWDLFGQESSNPRHGVRDGAGVVSRMRKNAGTIGKAVVCGALGGVMRR
jgi:hypothetical protein